MFLINQSKLQQSFVGKFLPLYLLFTCPSFTETFLVCHIRKTDFPSLLYQVKNIQYIFMILYIKKTLCIKHVLCVYMQGYSQIWTEYQTHSQWKTWKVTNFPVEMMPSFLYIIWIIYLQLKSSDLKLSYRGEEKQSFFTVIKIHMYHYPYYEWWCRYTNHF